MFNSLPLTKFLNGHWELFLGGLLILFMAWRSEGFYHPDEHFQLLEYANYKSGIAAKSGLAWEFHEQIRPGLQPFIAYSVLSLFRSLGISNPFQLAFILRLISGVLMFGLFLQTRNYLYKAHPSTQIPKAFLFLALFLWFTPFLNVRFSSENWAALSFFTGVLLLFRGMENPMKPKVYELILAGILLVLAFQFRYQMAFTGVGLGGWLWYQKLINRQSVFLLVSGGFLGLGIGLVADFWLYGTWQFTPYLYFTSNILEGKAAGFGIEPWWYYFTEYFKLLGLGINLILTILFVIGLYTARKHAFTWIFIPFLFGHILVDHKEFRFLFPMLIPFLFLVAMGWEKVPARIRTHPPVIVVLGLCFAINLLLLTYRLNNTAHIPIRYFRYFYDQAGPGGKMLAFYYDEKSNPYSTNIYGPWGLQMTFYRNNQLNLIPISTPQDMDKYDITKTKTFMINQTQPLPFSETRTQRLDFTYSYWQFEDLRHLDLFKPVEYGWKVFLVQPN